MTTTEAYDKKDGSILTVLGHNHEWIERSWL